MKTLIVEDHTSVSDYIQSLLKDEKDIEVIGVCPTIKQAYKAIIDQKPDLVLMDFELPDGNTFELLQKLKQINFKVIFITSYSEHALKAFKFSAIDYIVKPIDEIEFYEAIQKAKVSIEASLLQQKVDTLLHNAGNTNKTKIVLNTSNKTYVVFINEIVKCEVADNYVTLTLEDNSSITVTKQLKDIEGMLPAHQFIKPHKSFLINIDAISFVDKMNSEIHLKDKSKVPLASSRKEEVLRLMGK